MTAAADLPDWNAGTSAIDTFTKLTGGSVEIDSTSYTTDAFDVTTYQSVFLHLAEDEIIGATTPTGRRYTLHWLDSTGTELSTEGFVGSDNALVTYATQVKGAQVELEIHANTATGQEVHYSVYGSYKLVQPARWDYVPSWTIGGTYTVYGDPGDNLQLLHGTALPTQTVVWVLGTTGGPAHLHWDVNNSTTGDRFRLQILDIQSGFTVWDIAIQSASSATVDTRGDADLVLPFRPCLMEVTTNPAGSTIAGVTVALASVPN